MTDTKEREITPERLAQILALMQLPGSHSSVQNVTTGDVKNDSIRLIAALMLGLNIGLGLMLASHDRKIERLQDYLQAIYSQAPHLRPQTKE